MSSVRNTASVLTGQLAEELGLHPDELRARLGVVVLRPASGPPNATLARVAAIQAQQRAMRGSGAIDPDTSAHAVMCSAQTDADLARAGGRRDALINATNAGQGGVGGRFTPTRQE